MDITEEIIENIDIEEGRHRIEFEVEHTKSTKIVVINVDYYIDDTREYSDDLDNPPEVIKGSLDVFITKALVEDLNGHELDSEYDESKIWKHFRNLQKY